MTLNYVEPDYTETIKKRLVMLQRIRTDKTALSILKEHYKNEPWQMIDDWGITYDPRNIERGLPAYVPFVLFPRQRELLQFVHSHWRSSKDGVVPKSRDTGASWCCIAYACVISLLFEGVAVGFGSRKEEYVDRLGAPKSLFFKARVFLKHLPPELRGGWTEEKNGTFMRLTFPQTQSVITGEAGDNIGRGDRCSLYFVDESAHLERPMLAEAALSATTNCRIDISSVNGPDTPFSKKRREWPKEHVFEFTWRDDPRKTEEWYESLKLTKDPRVIAQEYDLDESAGAEGVIIPAQWVRSAIDAHIKLGFNPTGAKTMGLDVADEGKDKSALAGRHGVLLDFLDEWSGKGSDIFETVSRANKSAIDGGYRSVKYDGDGLGAGVKGDARVLGTSIEFIKYQGSGGVVFPDETIEQIEESEYTDTADRTNKDFFQNRKAQAWWSVRLRFLRTHRAVQSGIVPADKDKLISISSKIPNLETLIIELSQATQKPSGAGKMCVNKQPEGAKSPNLADAVVIAFAPDDTKPFDLSALL